MAIVLKFSPTLEINMGAANSVSADKILELGLEVLNDFRGLTFWGKMIKVLSTPGHCNTPGDITTDWRDTIREYFGCMMASQDREVYEVLFLYLVITIVVFVLSIFSLLLVVGRKKLKSGKDQVVPINEMESGRSRRKTG